MRDAALLRGIDLGGRRVTGAELCGPFEELRFAEVASFLASANVTFRAGDGADVPSADAVDLEECIEAALQTALGYPVDTFVRTAAEVTAIAEQQPFAAEVVAASSGKLQVTCLRPEPSSDAAAAALTVATDEDRLAVIGREWYWLPSGGLSQSSLDVPTIERALGRGTTRTARTVARLADRLPPTPHVSASRSPVPRLPESVQFRRCTLPGCSWVTTARSRSPSSGGPAWHRGPRHRSSPSDPPASRPGQGYGRTSRRPE